MHVDHPPSGPSKLLNFGAVYLPCNLLKASNGTYRHMQNAKIRSVNGEAQLPLSIAIASFPASLADHVRLALSLPWSPILADLRETLQLQEVEGTLEQCCNTARNRYKYIN